MSRRLAVALAAVAGAGLALPAGAAAHGLVGRQDLPIPRWLFAWGAAVVLVVSFVALATLWTKPQLQELRERVVWRVPGGRAIEVLGGAIGVGVFAVVVYAGLAGSQSPQENLAPSFVYYAFWVGVPFLSFVIGDVFALFNPWRAVARAVSWAGGRLAGEGGMPEPLAYPRWLGRWPAALGILGFGWVELVYVDAQDPSTVAVLALAYAAVQLVGMSLFGVRPWLENADAFGVTFSLLARVAPLHWRDAEAVTEPASTRPAPKGGDRQRAPRSAPVLAVRRPLAGVVALEPRPGTVALICTMIGTTAYDGFSQGALWSDVAPDLQRLFIDLGLSAETALHAALTIGLVGVTLLVAALYRLGIEGMRTVDPTHDAPQLARLFAHTLVPIAFAYVVAHYFSALTYQMQQLAYLISDPLGDGSNLFGTASATVDYGWISATAIWYVQVGALVVGHVAGLALAHDRALGVYRDARAATRSQYWMLVVMVGFTSLGLWLLSAAAQ